MTSSVTAQSLAVQNIEAKAGNRAELVVSTMGIAGMTALQFNLALPEGVAIAEGSATLGAATNGHTLSVQTLDNGDRLIALYSKGLNTFSDGELLRIPVSVGSDATGGEGRLYTVRTATTESVSHVCADATFTVTVTSGEVADEGKLTLDMFHEWDGCTTTSKVTNEDGGGELHLGEPLGSGALVYGIESVQYQHYADLTGYSELLIEGTPDVILRVLINRLEVGNGGGDDNGGDWTELNIVIGDDGTATVSLEDYPFVHLNAIKTAWHSPAGYITSLTLKKKGDVNGDGNVNVGDIMAVINVMATNAYDDKADVNQDGKVNVGDIMAVINIMAEK